MSIYTFIPVIFIVLYLGYWFYMKNKNSQQAQVVNNTDFKAEFANAEQYKKLLLKLVFDDLWAMPTIGKIIVFIILGLILLILSFLYQKLKDVLFKNDEEETN